MYAGHNGSVYKKTEDGWSHYQDGGWQDVDAPTRPEGERPTTQTRPETTSGATRTPTQTRTSGAASSRDMSQLNRDYSARQTGNQQFASRGGGGMRSGGRSRRR